MAKDMRSRTGSSSGSSDGGHVAIPMSDGAPLLPSEAAGYDKLTTPSGAESPAGSHHSHQSTRQLQQMQQQQQGDEETQSDLMHGINSFWAIVFPVCVTMIIASLAVVNYRNSSIEASMQTYLVYGSSDQDSGAQQLGMSLVNAVVIIGAIAVLTFGMALLYKYNCMKFLGGYIMFASTAILSFVGGQLVDSIVNDQLGWPVDWITFLFVMINFGFVGVISIFYQKGTPKFVQNGYLVLVSVILAWEFSMWPMWTTITFCFMFAIYDLCAVLTPCGPLKCLINLIQEKQAPLPGLLYEADVRDGVTNQPHQQPAAAAPRARKSPRPAAATASSSSLGEASQSSSSVHASGNSSSSSSNHQRAARPTPAPIQPRPAPVAPAASSDLATVTENFNRPRNVMESDFSTYDCETMDALIELLANFYRTFSPEDVWKAPQVAEKFFATQDRLWLLIFHKYRVCSCSIEIPCAVQARQDAKRRAAEEEDDDDKTIKLGLGDFIFYSVLVGRAAIYDFSTFAATFICIVMGLGGTLFLLAVLHKALPALPISIFLATFFYFWTYYLFVDFCDFMMVLPASV
uniref:Presenilin n=1 Tax=Globisporangium ultimum (strain ATCC 200006 / CBS 805.95 / DAOM BR144) TaxID=431595 RepID=K3WL66_GLOUD